MWFLWSKSPILLLTQFVLLWLSIHNWSLLYLLLTRNPIFYLHSYSIQTFSSSRSLVINLITIFSLLPLAASLSLYSPWICNLSSSSVNVTILVVFATSLLISNLSLCIFVLLVGLVVFCTLHLLYINNELHPVLLSILENPQLHLQAEGANACIRSSRTGYITPTGWHRTSPISNSHWYGTMDRHNWAIRYCIRYLFPQSLRCCSKATSSRTGSPSLWVPQEVPQSVHTD